MSSRYWLSIFKVMYLCWRFHVFFPSHDVMGFDVYLKYLAAPTLGGASAEAAIHGL